MGSAFEGLNIHKKKRFKSVLTKELSALADEEGKSSELSKYFFGEDLVKKLRNSYNLTESQGMWLKGKRRVKVN